MKHSLCALAIVTLALSACGKSAEEKAQATVCDARADIGTQVNKLKSLTPATVTKDDVTQSLDAIQKDLKDISGAQSDLSSARRSQVATATKEFTTSVQTIASEAVSSLSASGYKAALTTALQQLEASYKKTLARVDCS